MNKYKQILESWKKKRNQARLASLQRPKGIITAPRSAKLSRVSKALEKMGIDQPWAVQSAVDNPALMSDPSIAAHVNNINRLVSNFTPEQMERAGGLMAARKAIIQRQERSRQMPFGTKVARRDDQMKPLNPRKRDRRLKQKAMAIIDRMSHNYVTGNPSAEAIIQPFMPEKQN